MSLFDSVTKIRAKMLPSIIILMSEGSIFARITLKVNVFPNPVDRRFDIAISAYHLERSPSISHNTSRKLHTTAIENFERVESFWGWLSVKG